MAKREYEKDGSGSSPNPERRGTLAKTLAAIRTQLDAVKENRATKLLLDPRTSWDRYSTGFLVLVLFLTFTYLPRMLATGHPLALPGVIGSVLLTCALFSFNETWVIDFERRQVKLYRSLLRFAWCQSSHAFDELTQLGCWPPPQPGKRQRLLDVRPDARLSAGGAGPLP